MKASVPSAAEGSWKQAIAGSNASVTNSAEKVFAVGVAPDSNRTTVEPQQDCGSAASPQLPFMPSQQDFAAPKDCALNAKLKVGAVSTTNANVNANTLRITAYSYDIELGDTVQANKSGPDKIAVKRHLDPQGMQSMFFEFD